MTDRALEHLRVVELSDRIAGSYCAKFLADFGADVVKVERPVGGDPARRAGPYADDRFDIDGGGLYLFLNTNKKSVTLNADTATGAAILKEL
ncbi:MAG: CoA transferase, partial [Chloroflexi bacterium]|nr:CoA transferase [Chloroflexota bacterium]